MLFGIWCLGRVLLLRFGFGCLGLLCFILLLWWFWSVVCVWVSLLSGSRLLGWIGRFGVFFRVCCWAFSIRWLAGVSSCCGGFWWFWCWLVFGCFDVGVFRVVWVCDFDVCGLCISGFSGWLIVGVGGGASYGFRFLVW